MQDPFHQDKYYCHVFMHDLIEDEINVTLVF